MGVGLLRVMGSWSMLALVFLNTMLFPLSSFNSNSNHSEPFITVKRLKRWWVNFAIKWKSFNKQYFLSIQIAALYSVFQKNNYSEGEFIS